MRKIEGKLSFKLDCSLTIFEVSDDKGFLYYDLTIINSETNEVEYKTIYSLEGLQDFIIRGLIE